MAIGAILAGIGAIVSGASAFTGGGGPDKATQRRALDIQERTHRNTLEFARREADLEREERRDNTRFERSEIGARHKRAAPYRAAGQQGVEMFRNLATPGMHYLGGAPSSPTHPNWQRAQPTVPMPGMG